MRNLLVLFGGANKFKARIVERRSAVIVRAVAVSGSACAVLVPSQGGIVAEIPVIDQIISAGVGGGLQLHAVKVSRAGGAIPHSRCKVGDVASGSVRVCDLHASPICVGRNRCTAGDNIPGGHQDKLSAQSASAHAGSLHISGERVAAVGGTIGRLRRIHADSAAAGGAGNGQ